jgi:hypothetical protein
MGDRLFLGVLLRRRIVLLRVLFFSFLLLLLPSTVHAQKRVALVIGNSAYQYAPELTNPKNDAADMAAALRRHGFQVIDGFDLSRAALESKIRDFTIALGGQKPECFFTLDMVCRYLGKIT